MIKWREAYERVKGSREFNSYFGPGTTMSSFRPLTYSLTFTGVAAATTPGTYGIVSGPTNMPFPSGAIVLGITASCYQAQTTTTSFTYMPSSSPGRRDLFGLTLQYTGGELLTPSGMTQADALLGSGIDTIFPSRELLMPPSQGILVSTASLAPAPTLTVTVCFHCEVPRAVG